MKKSLIILLLLAFMGTLATTSTSCKTKEGCGLQEKVDPARVGKKSKTRSGNFSKKMNKRMG